MNEVGSTSIAKAQALSAASSNVTSNVAKHAQANSSGNALPAVEVKAEKIDATPAPSLTQEVPEKDLNLAVSTVKDYVQSLQRDIQFSVDKDLNKTVVKVLDSDSGEVIRQIPDDIFLELARRLKDDGEFRLLNALG